MISGEICDNVCNNYYKKKYKSQIFMLSFLLIIEQVNNNWGSTF